MSGFSAEWLSLREPADLRARNAALAEALAARFATRDRVNVTDLGSGTGANLRALAPLLPRQQSWTLIEGDHRLAAATFDAIARWADGNVSNGNWVRFHKGDKRITVWLREADLAAGLEKVLPERTDLVTASALFDLASAAFITATARASAARRASFYTVLTYNGVQHWTPRHPADNAVTSAFNGHQMCDKGLGVAAGPMAPAHLADAFRLEGYSVQEADSPWRLGPGDARLLSELQKGTAAAVAETGRVDARSLEAWAGKPRTNAEIGHTDTLAFPE